MSFETCCQTLPPPSPVGAGGPASINNTISPRMRSRAASELRTSTPCRAETPRAAWSSHALPPRALFSPHCFDIGQRLQNAMRSFISDHAAVEAGPICGQPTLPAPSGAHLAWPRESPHKGSAPFPIPEAISALSAAFAPGMGITRTPAAIAARTNSQTGIRKRRRARIADHRDPASLLQQSDQLHRPRLFIVLVIADGGGGNFEWFSSFCVWRVSSQAIRSTPFNTRSARSVMSSRLPIGVATR